MVRWKFEAGVEAGIYARPCYGEDSNTFEVLMFTNDTWYFLHEDTLGWVEAHKDFDPAQNGTPLIRLKDSPMPPQVLRPTRQVGPAERLEIRRRTGKGVAKRG